MALSPQNCSVGKRKQILDSIARIATDTAGKISVGLTCEDLGYPHSSDSITADLAREDSNRSRNQGPCWLCTTFSSFSRGVWRVELGRGRSGTIATSNHLPNRTSYTCHTFTTFFCVF